MHLTRYYILFLVLLIPLSMQGRQKDYVLNGQLKVKDGDTYPYQLVFDVSHSVIKGYSITKMPDGSETKSTIKGLINKQQHVLIISETKLLSAPQKDVTICLVNAILTYKLHKNSCVISGKFAGQDSEKKYCGEGTVEFLQPLSESKLFDEDTAFETQTLKPEPSAEIKNEQTVSDDKITAGIQKQFDWNTDTCILEIWDGGVIDGDVVSVLINDQAALTNFTLAKEKKQLRLPLTKKINIITIVAENEGINPPNTAQMILYDGAAQYRITAFNKQGEKAVVVIKKK